MAAVSPPKPAPTITTLMPVLDFVSVFGMSLVFVMVDLGRLLKSAGLGLLRVFYPMFQLPGIGNFATVCNRENSDRDFLHGEYAPGTITIPEE